MEAYAHQAKDKLSNLTETVSTQANQVASDVRDQSIKAGASIRDKVVNPLDTIDKARAGFDSVFNAQRLDQAKAKLDSEASLVVGYKDQFIGAFKEAFGRILNDHDLKMAGAEQRSKGEAEVKLQKTLEERKIFEKQSAQFLEALKRREAVMADLVHFTYTTQLRHVEAPLEPAVADLFLDSPFKLKQWNKQPLLQEIRERRTMKPMLFVQVREKGLMNSIPLTKKDLSTNFKARSAALADLRWAIRHSGAQKLKSVPEASISDRSAPRLERNRAAVYPEGNRARLLEEVQEGAQLKHVETVDKAQPAIETKGMGEMRQATELKQF